MNDLKLDSWEERYFSWWCDELIEAGYIREVKYHPEPFSLSDKVSMTRVGKNSKTLFQPHEYTCDARIEWQDNALGVFFRRWLSEYKQEPYFLTTTIPNYSYVEVKPPFDQNGKTAQARINCKWVFEKYGLYVHIVVPRPQNKKNRKGYAPTKTLFTETFTPQRYLLTDGATQQRKLPYKPRTLEEFLNAIDK